MSAVLTLLRIKNLALVEELEWQIAPGFVAVTGETGAGTSIIIGALQLLPGERADFETAASSKRSTAASCRAARMITRLKPCLGRNNYRVVITSTST